MSSLIPFQFGAAAIRVVEIDGEPWFVGKDVAAALGYADTTNALKQHCRGVAKHHPILDSLGRTQEARVLNEANVLRLIVNSNLPAAEKFEAWVFEEVLPTIRRTGSYSHGAPKAIPREAGLTSKIRAIEMVSRMVAAIPGVRENDLLTVKLDMIERETGLPATEFRKALPSVDAAEVRTLNATAIGVELGVSAIKANQMMEVLGLQTREGRGWVLTEVGRVHAKVVPFTRNGHTGTDIQWFESVLDFILESERGAA